MSTRKPNLKKLKVHLVRGCAAAWRGNGETYVSEPVAEAYIEESWNVWGPGPNDKTLCYSAVPKITDDVREVTCWYCKSKLMNELWFADWSQLTAEEHALVLHLRAKREARKTREGTWPS